MVSEFWVPSRRTSVVAGLTVALCMLSLVGPAASPAAAGIGQVWVHSGAVNGWYGGDVRVTLELDVRGRSNGFEEQLHSATCAVQGERVAELPALPDDDYYTTDQVLRATVSGEGQRYLSCWAQYRTRTYSCTWWCTNDPWQHATQTYNRVFSIDMTAPTVEATTSVQPNGAGWYNQPFTVTWNGHDSLSGVNRCTDPASIGPQVQHGTLYIRGECWDRADNRGERTVVLNVDMVAPTLDPVVPHQIVRGSTDARAEPRATDHGSGVDTESCDPLDTSTVGMFTTTCTATDVAGNTTSQAVPYEVVPREHPVVVTVSGAGTVQGTTDEIDCPTVCMAWVQEDAAIDLVATAAHGWLFVGWTNDCSGTGVCSLVVDAAKDVGATFVVDGDGDGVADTPPPTNKDQCKQEGWATFNNPSFANQGRCVSYVQANGNAGHR